MKKVLAISLFLLVGSLGKFHFFDSNSVQAAESRLDKERDLSRKRVAWMYEAKYGVMVHFLSASAHFKPIPWTPEEWDQWVDAVDVEGFAAQCAEIGAGWVLISLGQRADYYCSPNPVYEKFWGFDPPGRYASTRDLPMDLYNALQPYGIRMMLYTPNHPPMISGETAVAAGWEELQVGNKRKKRVTPAAKQRWADSLKWWSKHYGRACSGWWIDGTYGNYGAIVPALRAGNPDTVITGFKYKDSDITLGHCTFQWNLQSAVLPPISPGFAPKDENGQRNKSPSFKPVIFYGPIDPQVDRWVESAGGAQWHLLQFLGRRWSYSAVHKPTEELVEYARKVTERGGIITWDIGVHGKLRDHPLGPNGERNGPYLRIPQGQFEQLKAIRDAVKDIKR